MNALIIDDSWLSRNMLGKQLSRFSSFEIFQADSGKTGIKQYEEIKPELVFVDLLMPEICGIEVIRHIRKSDNSCYIAVVSSDIQESTQEEVLELGANIFIAKPISEKKLTSILDQFEQR